MNSRFGKYGVYQSWYIGLVILIVIVAILSISQLGHTNHYVQEINKGTLFIEDTNHSLDIEQIQKYQNSQWQEEKREMLSFGMNQSPHWFKFFLPDDVNTNPHLIEIDYVMLDKVDIWFFSNDRLVTKYRSGDSYPFESRPINNEKFLFPIPELEGPISAIIRVETSGVLKVPLRIWERKEYLIHSTEHNLLLGLFLGFLAAMMLSNLFFYVSTRTTSFLSYSFYVASVGLTIATMQGLGFKYLWPDWVWLQWRSVGVFATFAVLFASICTRQILQIDKYSRDLDKVMKSLVWVLSLSVIASFLIPYHFYILYFVVLFCLTSIFVFAVTLLLWFKGVKLARLYLLAWSVLIVAGLLAALESFNILHIGMSVNYFLILGAAIKTFMLAFLLVISYTVQRDEQYQSQELLILEERLAREAQEETLKLKEEAQENLEYSVQERTLELEIALRELSETNAELEQQTLTDSLTGIRNRKHFDRKLQAEVRRCRRERTKLSIVMLDIDNFKNINDTYGHVTGDEVIKNVASVLKGNLRRVTDDACRYGGEEFALILPNTDFEGANLLAENLRMTIEKLVTEVDDLELSVTISAGVATTVVTSVDDEKNLLESADKALYQAKRNGRNRVESVHLHPRNIV